MSRPRRHNRLLTDSLREIAGSKGRFAAVFLLSALAVAFLIGLRSAAPDMEFSADRYFDQHSLMDVRILCNLGLTDDDLDAIADLDGVQTVEGSHQLDAIVGQSVVHLISMPDKLNTLRLVEGRLPETPAECVTEQDLLNSLDAKVGDTITLEPGDSADKLSRTTFKIVGVVDSPLYVSLERGSSSIGNGLVDAYLYLPDSAFSMDYWTAAYVTLDGASSFECYDDEYGDFVNDFVDSISDFADKRASLRAESLRDDAQSQLDDAQQTYDDAKADAEAKLADAKAQLDSTRATLDDGWSQLASGRQTYEDQVASAQQELADSLATLNTNQAEYDAQLAAAGLTADTLESTRDSLNSQLAQLDQLQAAQAQLASLLQVQTALAEAQGAYESSDKGDTAYQTYAATLAAIGGQIGQAVTPENASDIIAGVASQVATLQAVPGIDTSADQIAASRASLDTALGGVNSLIEMGTALSSGWSQYNAGVDQLSATISSTEAQLAATKTQLDDGEQQYATGLSEYQEAQKTTQDELDKNRKKLDDAQELIDDIEDGTWYVLTRDSNIGYATYESDSERMGNLANVFPLIFFLVAALSALTSMTRMVEEKRTEIGCLKALGFSKWSISVKYLGYAAVASVGGGVLGTFLGATTIPAVIFYAWHIMYSIPQLTIRFYAPLIAFSVVLAIIASVGAAAWACLATLLASPADLMRPKSPKPGRRVLLERIGPLWRHLSFIRKVTARNLFRYKRRFWMTVIGIGGCTALVITGFGLHDSIFDILTKQFDQITLYDASVALSSNIDDDEVATIDDYLSGEQLVADFTSDYEYVSKATSPKRTVDKYVYLFAVGDRTEFGRFVDLHHRSDKSAVTIPDEGVVIDEKLSELLSVKVGDTITVEGPDDKTADVTVQDICENYTYHYVYLTKSYYEQLFGAVPPDNIMMVTLKDDTAENSDTVSTALMKLPGVTSYYRIQDTRDTFNKSLNAINYAVLIIITAAAALTFIVLFNLTNINITERRRELATLKVLGFYNRETDSYVWRENIILTIIGIALGLVMGKYLHGWLIGTVEIEIVMFGRDLAPHCYVWGILLTIVFALIVNIASHRALDRIDMVESLKSVE